MFFLAIVMWFWEVLFFPLHVVSSRFLSFWSRNVKSFWQKRRFGWAWARKTATDFSLEETQKKHVLTHTRFQARWWWKLETQSRSLAMLVFSWGYTCAFPGFCGNTSHMSRFLSAMCIDVEECGSTSSHKRLQSLFMSLCGNTYVFTCSGSVKSRI